MIRFSGKIHPPAKQGDTGYDIEVDKSMNVAAGETVTIPTGLRLQPSATFLAAAASSGFSLDIHVRPRSSASKRGLLVHKGTIDAGYTGVIGIVVTNLNKETLRIKKGSRIAQIVFGVVFDGLEFVEAEASEFEKTERGDAGFGSTTGDYIF